MDEDGNANIYEDLPDFRYDITLDQLNASIAKLEAENHVLQSRLVQVIEEKKVLEANCSVLNTNISSLLKTAKLEIQRKERTIVELRAQLNEVMPSKKQFGLKRQRETAATPSPRKKPRFSPRKRQEERLQPPKRDTRSSSKPEVVGDKDRTAHDERPTNVERERRDHLVSVKENTPLKDALAMEEPQVIGNCAAPSENLVDPGPTIAAPPLPALECPTLFSCRMYKRLYGRDRENADPALACAGSTGSIQPADVGEPPKLPESKLPPSHNSGSSRHHPPSCLSSRVTSEDLRIYLGVEDPFKSDSSSSSSSKQLEIKPVATSYVRPNNRYVETSIKVNPADLKPEPQKPAEVPPKKLEVPIHHPSAVQPASSPSVPPLKTQDISSKVNVEHSQSKSPPSIAKAGLLSVGKTRKQTVAAIRPIQTLAAKENSTTVEKSDENSPIPHEPGGSSTGNLPESKITEMNSGVCCAGKSSRRLKMPGLPGSAKGRTVRQVFAPISNQRCYSLPTAGNQNDSDKKSYNELGVVNTVSVTSELTVRVEDSKLELKRPSSAEALFGSPVKWADDSLDSPVTEVAANSRRLYSIFGSPLKNVDSNSSEHPFSVPPGAYEDSCWTSQIPDIVPIKSSVGDANIHKQSQRSQESALIAEIKPKERSRELNDAGKVSAASSICPPPSSSVIKKHVSIFSPMKDSKLSTSNVPDEPSRSNTGICFPFPRAKYDDSVLGQFDDTAQFVSALAKVDSKISPLNTPVKSGDGSNHTRSVIVEKNPTSFQQVFKKKTPEEAQQNHEPSNLGIRSVGVIASEKPNLSALTKFSLNEDHPAGKPNQSVNSKHASNENHETENGNAAIGRTENPQPQSMFEAPPAITITPPKTESSLRLIHRPNFASSTILSVKSWFPNAPVKKVTPRKTPRLVSTVSRCASPKGLEGSAGARIAINDAFIIEQEERVRRWELDHLYENTLRSASGSPMKSVNGSPTRKRTEPSGKISPSKRSPRKQVSPCKSPRRAEIHTNLGIEPVLQRPSDTGSQVSGNASNKKATVNQLVPDSENQTDLVAYSADATSSRITTEPIKSLPNTTQKLLTMLDAVMTKTKYSEPGFDSSLAEAKVDLASKGVKSQVEDKDTAADHAKSSDNFGPEPPSRSTLKQEIVPSRITRSDHTESRSNAEEEGRLQKDTKEQAVLADPPDSAALSLIPPPYMPLMFNDKSGPLPFETTLMGSKENVTEATRVGSEILTVSAPGSSNVTNAKLSQIALSGSAMPSTDTEANKRKKQGKVAQNANNSKASETIVQSERNDSSDCLITPPINLAKSSGGPTGKKVPRSKYAAVISRVKPSAPQSKAVAALITSSINSASPRQSITTSVVPSAKKINFKRSSALKPDAQKGAGNILMNSIRSTFFQGTPTSSAKVDNAHAHIQTPKLRPSRRKSTTDLGVNSINDVVTIQSATHKPVVTRFQKNVVHSAAETAVQGSAICSRESAGTDVVPHGVALSKAVITPNVGRDILRKPDESIVQDSKALSREPAAPVEMECSVPGQWKLVEVDHSTKPISLLQRFRESKENYTLHDPLDSKRKEPSNAIADSLNVEVEKDVISSGTNPTFVQEGSKSEPDLSQTPSPVLDRGFHENPETHLMPKSDGVKVNQDNTKLLPKSPNIPRSSFRKTILLDSPLKMVTPTKGKRSGDSMKSPKPKEKCGESVKSPKPKEKLVEPETVERSRTRTASGGRGTSKKKPKKPSEAFAEPERPKVELPRKSRYTVSRYSRRRRSVSRSVSPRNSRLAKRDESPKPRQRKKSRTTDHDSPERSARKSEVMKPDDKSHLTASKSSDRRSKIISSEPGGRKSEVNSSESSDRKSKITTSESAGVKSRINSPESSDRKSKTASSLSVGKQLKSSSSEPADRCSKTSSSDSACRSSKMSSCESAARNWKPTLSESVDDIPVVHIVAQAPRSKTAPAADYNDKKGKSNSAYTHNCETPRYSEFRASVGASTSTPRIQPGATPATLGPSLVIPENRRPNFGTMSASKQTEFVVSVGKRPALFSPS